MSVARAFSLSLPLKRGRMATMESAFSALEVCCADACSTVTVNNKNNYHTISCLKHVKYSAIQFFNDSIFHHSKLQIILSIDLLELSGFAHGV